MGLASVSAREYLKKKARQLSCMSTFVHICVGTRWKSKKSSDRERQRQKTKKKLGCYN